MHRIDTPTASADKFGAGKNGFTAGNPGAGTPPTALSADFFDALQQELATLIEAMGIVLNKADNSQLLTALRSPVGSGAGAAVSGTGGTTSGPGLKGTGGAPNGVGVWGVATGSGSGVSGTGSTTGAAVAANPVSVNAGTRAAIAVSPQKADLGTVTKGDVAMLMSNVASPGDAKLVAAASASQVDRYVPQSFAVTADQSLTFAAPSATLYTIPANTLRAGSVIEIGLTGTLTGDGGGANTNFYLRLGFDDGSGFNGFLETTSGIAPQNIDATYMHAFVTIRANPGAAVAARGGGFSDRMINASAAVLAYDVALTYNTTNQIAVKIEMVNAVNGDVYAIRNGYIRVT